MEQGAAFAEMRRAAVGVEDEIVGAGGHGQSVGHGDGAVDGLDEGGVPGGHLAAALLGDERHGKFVRFGGGVDREADVGGEFGGNGVGKGLLIASVNGILEVHDGG